MVTQLSNNSTKTEQITSADIWYNNKVILKSKRRCDIILTYNNDRILETEAKMETDRAILAAKAHYEDKIVEQSKENPKRFWNYTRHYTRSSSTIDMLQSEGKKFTEDQDKAQILNNFFSSVLTNETPVDSSHHNSEGDGPQFVLRDIHVTTEAVRKKLLKLKNNKAAGPDNISVNVMRQCPDLDQPLHIIFNQSIQTGRTPQDWRDANITPLFKKGSRVVPNNYRPVSLTSQAVKILERIIYDELIALATKNKTISCDQHGFQDKCSCVTQLLECLNDWTRNYDDKIQTDIIYLDFAKAFDTVPHQRLIIKLRKYGVRGKVLQWIESFLSNRRQRVVLRNGISDWEHVKSGVPQGSILGPLLFLYYIIDMPDEIGNVAKMFADDTKVYAKIQDEQDCHSLQDDLNRLGAWSRKWLLRFNETKCVVLGIRECIRYVYTLNGYQLETVSHQKDLGVHVSDSLKPEKHINEICKKARQRIGIIRRCFTNLTESKVKLLYQAIVRPILEYASPAWNPNLKKDIDNLEKVQERCSKLCHPPLTLPALADRRRVSDLCEVYKYTHQMYKTDSSTFFTHPQRQLRGHSLKLEKHYCGTKIRQNFFSYRVVDDWNALAPETATASSLASFKRHLRSLPKGEEG